MNYSESSKEESMVGMGYDVLELGCAIQATFVVSFLDWWRLSCDTDW